MFKIKIKILQFLADLIIKSLENEENEMIFERLISMGIYLDFYATSKGIYLN
jgi:hypothetical protein